MNKVVLLDAGPLGLATNPRRSGKNLACNTWIQSLVAAGSRIILPEIADYEVRRELLRANKLAGIAQLNALAELLEYLPITTAAMSQAALFWSQARQTGQPTAGDKTIDGDMILAAQRQRLEPPITSLRPLMSATCVALSLRSLWHDITAAP